MTTAGADDLGPRASPAGTGGLVELLDKTVDQVLGGQVSSAIVITNGPNGLQANWSGMDPPGAIGSLQITLALLVSQFAGNPRRT